MYDLSGRREKRQSFGPSCSRQPDRMAAPSGSKTVTELLEKTTLQPASQSLPMPTKLCLKEGMMWPDVGTYEGSFRLSSPVAEDE